MRIITIALITLALAIGPAATGQATQRAGVTGTEDPAVVWALGRFTDAGLELPPIDFSFSTDRAACGGNMAVAVHGGSMPKVVVCSGTDASSVVLHRTLLHEIAHVWAADRLSSRDRDAFMAVRGLDEWTDTADWSMRGSEQAAEVITWALMDTELSMLTLPDHDPARLAIGYRVLTGHDVPARPAA